MPKVNFYAMKLDFANLIKMDKDFPSDTDFAFLVFQPEIENSEKRQDEYILTAYRVGSDWTTKARVDSRYLIPDSAKSDPIKGKLNFANLPFSRKRIKDYIKQDPNGNLIDYLHLVPEKYDRDDSYISYRITPINKTDHETGEGALPVPPPPPPPDYLQPSPPANT
jgi:hypothetical protein